MSSLTLPAYDLQAVALATVLRAPQLSGPWLAIPRPGERPFVVSREMVANCIKGGKVLNVELNGTLQISVKRERSSGNYKLVNQVTGEMANDSYQRWGWHRSKIVEESHKWAAQRRKKPTPVARSKFSARIRDTQAAIERLEKRLACKSHNSNLWLRKPTPPQHPTLYDPRCEYGEKTRRSVVHWYAEKYLRKRVHRIMAAHRKDKNLTPLYQALEAAGFPARRYTDIVRTVNYQREPDALTFYRHMFRYSCGLMPKPWPLQRESWRDDETPAEQMDRWRCACDEYVTDLRNYQAALGELASLRELLASYQAEAERERSTQL